MTESEERGRQIETERFMIDLDVVPSSLNFKQVVQSIPFLSPHLCDETLHEKIHKFLLTCLIQSQSARDWCLSLSPVPFEFPSGKPYKDQSLESPLDAQIHVPSRKLTLKPLLIIEVEIDL